MRVFLSLLAGAVIAVVCVGVLESIGHMIFPPPPGVDVSDPEVLKTIMDDIPLGAQISVLVAWTVATFAGGSVAAWLARAGTWPAWAIAGLMLVLIGINLVWIPHPTWMIICAVLLTIIAGFLASRMPTSAT